MKIKKNGCFIIIVVFISIMFSSTTFAAVGDDKRATGATVYSSLSAFTVVLGDNGYDLDYANNNANEDEISQAVINSKGEIYIKTIYNTFVDNNTGKSIESNDPKVYGKLVNYKDTVLGFTYKAYIVKPTD